MSKGKPDCVGSWSDGHGWGDALKPLIDPRFGDVEDDVSSTKQRSLLRIAGSLLAEISLPKLVAAWGLLIVVPGIVVGFFPLIATAWLAMLRSKVDVSPSDLWPLLALLPIAVLGWMGGRPLLRAAEQAFWSLNSLVVQPCYTLCREGLQHLAERLTASHGDAQRYTRLRVWTAAGAGMIMCALGLSIAYFAWPYSRWIGNVADLAWLFRLLLPALANATVALGLYLAAAALVWGIADARMGQPRDLMKFDTAAPGTRTWRVAHLSDVHCVGERYGYRIESGRSGPRGNDRLANVLARLDAIHAERPLDFVLITGDMTDAGRSAEWAELFGTLARYPRLAQRTLMLPGNHDVNVVDRANPARLELPTSPGRCLRQLRTLSAIMAVQGDKARVVDLATKSFAATLSAALAPHRDAILSFADSGGVRLGLSLARVWADAFPMMIPPDAEDGLGVVLFNSTAETHFSFTNALGLITAEQMEKFNVVTRKFPRACWIVAMHHHLVEYPRPVKAFSERIGTALINGSWLMRQLQKHGARALVMHGHRHFDWVGTCGNVKIISAPSPVMEALDEETTRIYVHNLAVCPEGLCLLAPEIVEIAGTNTADRAPVSSASSL